MENENLNPTELIQKLNETESKLQKEIQLRKEQEARFLKVQNRYEKILENYPKGMVNIFDTKYRYIFVYGEEIKRLGFTKEKLVGRTLTEVYPKETAFYLMKFLDGVWRNNKIEFEYNFNGNIYFVAASPLKNDMGSVSEMIVITQNITELKKYQKELQMSEEQFKMFADRLPAGIFIKDAKGRYTFLNKYNEEKFGDKNWRGKTAYDFFPKDIADSFKEDDEKVLKEGAIKSSVSVKDKDGQLRYFSTQYFPIEKSDGSKLIGGISLDITEEIEIRLALEESEKFKNSLLESSPVPIHSLDLQGRVVTWNKAAEKVFGWKADEVIGKYLPIVQEEKRSEFEQIKDIILSGKSVVDKELIRQKKDGTKFIASLSASPIYNHQGEISGIISVVFDITEEKHNKEKITRLSNIFENSLNEIYLIDAETLKFVDVNKAAQKNLGYTLEELKKMTPIELKPEVTLEQFNRLIEPLKKGVKDQISFETLHQRKNKTTYNVEVHLQLLQSENKSYYSAIIIDITDRKKAEEEIKRYASIVSLSSDLMSFMDKDYRYLAVNEAYSKASGLSKEKIIGKTASEVLGNEVFEKIVKPNVDKCLSGEIVNYQGWVKYPAYEPKYVDANYYPDYDSNDKIRGVVINVRDITRQKRVEEKLIERNDFIQTVMDNLPIGIALNHIDGGDSFYMNKKFEEIYGWSSKEITKVSNFFPKVYPDKEYREQIMKQVLNDIATGDPQKMHWENCIVTHQDGSKHIVNAQNIPLPEQNTMVSTVIDVTAQKEAENRLRESEERYKTLIESAPDTIAIHLNGKLVFANQSAVKLLEADSLDQIIGMDISKIVHPNRQQEVNRRIEKILNDEAQYYLIEEEYLSLKGKRIPVEVTAVKILYNNKPAVQVIIRDISERKKAEQALRESEERYRMLVENQTDLVVKVDSDGKFQFVSDSYCKTFGKSEEQLLGKNFRPLVHKDDIKTTEEVLKKLFRPPYRCYLEQRAKTVKGWRWFGWSDKAIVNSNGEIESIIGVGRDITDRKNAELKVIEERNKAEQYLETAAIMMLALNKKGNVTMINSTGAKILGYTKKYIIGKNWFDNFIPEEIRPKMRRIFVDSLKGNMSTFETYENPVLCRYNKTKIIGWHSNYLKDEQGNILGILSSGEDVTESIRLRNELRETNEKLVNLTQHMHKLREQERAFLAREIHDDLGQSLTAVKLDLSTAVQVLEEKEKAEKKINSAIQITNSTIKTVQEITSELRPGLIDDLGLIPAIEWYTTQFAERAKLKIDFSSSISESDILQPHKIVLYRIIQESLTNVARHARATRIKIKLSKKNKNLILTIDDNGKGISEEDKHRVDAFGLIGMNERAHSINGILEIKGKKNRGTKIQLIVPLSEKK